MAADFVSQILLSELQGSMPFLPFLVSIDKLLEVELLPALQQGWCPKFSSQVRAPASSLPADLSAPNGIRHLLFFPFKKLHSQQFLNSGFLCLPAEKHY